MSNHVLVVPVMSETVQANGMTIRYRSGYAQFTPDHLAAVAHAIAAEPDLARVIVEAGTVRDSATVAEPAADDEAAVHAMFIAYASNEGTEHDGMCAILAAIKAGKVRGVSWSADTSADLHAMWKSGLEDGKLLMRAELAAERHRADLAVDARSTAEDQLSSELAAMTEQLNQSRYLVLEERRKTDAARAEAANLRGLLREYYDEVGLPDYLASLDNRIAHVLAEGEAK